MPEPPIVSDETSPATAPAVWRELGDSGALAALYADAPIPPAPRLVELISGLDEEHPTDVVLSVCVQAASALPLLGEHATSGAAATAYRAALQGRSVVALAATDAAGAGSDLMALGTTATLTPGGVVLDGEKRWITNACHADHALVLARHRPLRHFTSFVWVLVPIAAPGVTVRAEDTDSFRGAGIGRIALDGVRLGSDHVLGNPGRGLATFARHITTERLAGGLWAGAICRRVLRTTHTALTERPLRDGALWDNAAIRERFARCVVEAWRIDASCLAYLTDHGTTDGLRASMLLKVSIAESLDAVLAGCAALLGAESFIAGGVGRLRADAAMFGVAGGATGSLLAGIADQADDLVGRRFAWHT